MGNEAASKIKCSICSRLFLGSRLADHVLREHLESIPQLLASLGKSRKTLEEDTRRRTFPCTGCSRIFRSEQELIRHWYGRHGRSVNGHPEVPGSKLSPAASEQLARLFASALGKTAATSQGSQGQTTDLGGDALGPDGAMWIPGSRKLRRGGGPDRGYSYAENRRMAERAALLSEASAKPPSPPEPYRGSFPVRPPVKRPGGGGSSPGRSIRRNG